MAETSFAGGASTGSAYTSQGQSFEPYVSPAVKKMTLASNYLDIRNNGWAQQYLPDLYEQEVDRYGNRTISGLLSMLSAELPIQSDQVIWSEQGRLHLAYKGTVSTNSGAVTSTKNIDTGDGVSHGVRVGATVVCQYQNSSDASNDGKVFKAVVTESGTTTLTVKPYGGATIDDVIGTNANSDADNLVFFVYGSEFTKGSDTMSGSIEPSFQTYTNKPMIIKDHFEVNGSDTAQIGWIEVAGESGQGGYLWYLKSSGDTRVRFNDYMEMTMIEAEDAASTADFDTISNASVDGVSGIKGSEGMFQAIDRRGIVTSNAFDLIDSTTDPDTNVEGIKDFDDIIAELDKQGSIEENMLYLNRKANLFIDDLLANLSAGAQGGTAFGVFNNSEDMALNLGFTGFRRGGYDFYKTDWKYLNDASTRGLFAASAGNTVDGVLIPAGTSSVYDQVVGANVRRPFLHVRYRASEVDDRKLKSWVTGSVGGPTSSNIDKMEINYLSERCLVVQAANNFMLFK